MAYIISNIILEAVQFAFYPLLIGFFGYTRRKSIVPFICFAVFAMVTAQIPLFLIEEQETAASVSDFVILVYMLIVPYLIFRPARKATFFFINLTISSLIDYFVSLAESFTGNVIELYENIIYSAVYAILIALILIGMFVVRAKPYAEFLDKVSIFIYIAAFIVSLSSYYETMLNRDASYFEAVAASLKIFSIIIVVACIAYVVSLYNKLQQGQKDAENQLKIELNHYEEMVSKNRDIRSFRHDIKNNLLSMKALIDSNRIDELAAYINDLYGNLETTGIKYATGNYLADAIISDKSAAAEKSGTKIEFSGTIPASGISNSDLCTILGNSLDNAIRACEEIEGAVIKIICRESDGSAVISVSNPTTENITIKNNSLKTTKADKENHGLGIANVRRTAEKYNGYTDISCENKTFTIETGLFLKKNGQ